MLNITTNHVITYTHPNAWQNYRRLTKRRDPSDHESTLRKFLCCSISELSKITDPDSDRPKGRHPQDSNNIYFYCFYHPAITLFSQVNTFTVFYCTSN